MKTSCVKSYEDATKDVKELYNVIAKEIIACQQDPNEEKFNACMDFFICEYITTLYNDNDLDFDTTKKVMLKAFKQSVKKYCELRWKLRKIQEQETAAENIFEEIPPQ